MGDDDNLTTLDPDELPAEPAVPAPAPVVAAPTVEPEPVVAPPAPPVVDEAEADPEKESDPRVAGILRALQRERTENKRIGADNKRMQPIAEGAAVLASRLQARPDVLALLNGDQPFPPKPAEPPVPDGPPDAVLRELAESLTLIGADGKADLSAAGRVYALLANVAKGSAESAVKARIEPIQAERLSERASARQIEAYAAAEQLGVSRETAQPIFEGIMATNPSIMADPAQASAALVFAAGLEFIKMKNGGKLPAAATIAAPVAAAVVSHAQAPVFQEPSGNRPPSSVLTEADLRLAKRIGIAPAEMQKAAERLAKPKDFYPMEDDE